MYCGIKAAKDWDWEGTYLRGGGVLANLCRQISPQPKVGYSHCVEYGVKGPHCNEYFPHGAEVLLHAMILNGVSISGEDPCS